MSSRPELIAAITEIIATRSPNVSGEEPLEDHMALGAEGLGLDSIAIVEVLLECEARFGVRTINLLEGETITVGRIADQLATA